MTLRDEIASVLGSGNDDETAYAQADAVLQILNRWDINRSEAGETPWDDAVRRIMRPATIDLTDPETENLVADAIVSLEPDGAYVPLTRRYPWRFNTDAADPQHGVTLLDAVVEALRASASVHEAEGIPHLVPALTALAEALEHGGLIPGPPPGRCGNVPPDSPVGLSCNLRAGHTGQHEAEYRNGSAHWGEAS